MTHHLIGPSLSAGTALFCVEAGRELLFACEKIAGKTSKDDMDCVHSNTFSKQKPPLQDAATGALASLEKGYLVTVITESPALTGASATGTTSWQSGVLEMMTKTVSS